MLFPVVKIIPHSTVVFLSFSKARIESPMKRVKKAFENQGEWQLILTSDMGVCFIVGLKDDV